MLQLWVPLIKLYLLLLWKENLFPPRLYFYKLIFSYIYVCTEHVFILIGKLCQVSFKSNVKHNNTLQTRVLIFSFFFSSYLKKHFLYVASRDFFFASLFFFSYRLWLFFYSIIFLYFIMNSTHGHIAHNLVRCLLKQRNKKL